MVVVVILPDTCLSGGLILDTGTVSGFFLLDGFVGDGCFLGLFVKRVACMCRCE